MAIRKMNYYKGEFLHAEDFKCDQDFHSSLRKIHNISLHTSGIVYGLDVIAGAGKITVKQGMAIDSQGREMILDADRDVAVNSPTNITITYLETDDPPTTEAGFTGVKQSTITCKVIAGTDPDGIVLATVTNATTNPVTLNAAYKRLYAAPIANGDVTIGGNLEVKGKLTVQGETRMVSTDRLEGNVILGDADTDVVTIEGSLLTGHTSGKLKIGSPVDITGALSVTESLSLPSGKEIVFADNGQIRCFNNDHRILFRRTENKLELREYGDLVFSPGATAGAETAKVVMQSNGNVGIGATNPAAHLEINNGWGDWLFLRQQRATEGGGGFRIHNPWGEESVPQGDPTRNRLEIAYQTSTGVVNWGQFVIQGTTGNIGIGTATPDRSLTIANTTASSYLNVKDNAREILLGVDASGGILSVMSNHDLILRTGTNNEKMRVTAGGKVGIGTSNPGAKLEVAGTIKSPMWNITQVFNNEAGPMPKSKQFTMGGGVLLVFASGSGWSNNPGQIGMEIKINNVLKGSVKGFTNEASSHKTFSANFLVVNGIAAGSYTLSLTALTGTNTDANDFFSVTILELPFD